MWSARLWCAIRYTATPGLAVLDDVPAQLIQHPAHVITAEPAVPGGVGAGQPLLLRQPGAKSPGQRGQQGPSRLAGRPGGSHLGTPRRAHPGQVGVERVLDRVAHLLLPARLGGVHWRRPQLVGDQPGQQERAAAGHRRLPGQLASRPHPGPSADPPRPAAPRCRRACPRARAPARPGRPGPAPRSRRSARPAATARSRRAAAPGWRRSPPRTGPAAAAAPPRSRTPGRVPHPARPPRSPARRRPPPPRAAPARPARRRSAGPAARPAPPPAPAGRRSSRPPGPRSALGRARAQPPTASPGSACPIARPSASSRSRSAGLDRLTTRPAIAVFPVPADPVITCRPG